MTTTLKLIVTMSFRNNVTDADNSIIYFQKNIDEAIIKFNSVIG